MVFRRLPLSQSSARRGPSPPAQVASLTFLLQVLLVSCAPEADSGVASGGSTDFDSRTPDSASGSDAPTSGSDVPNGDSTDTPKATDSNSAWSGPPQNTWTPPELSLGAPLTVSGLVTTNDGEPIANALVSRTLDPFTFVKTDEDGKYSLDSFENDHLTVAAYDFETQRDVVVEAAQVDVRLATDPLLAREELHVSFDHLRPGPGYSKDELKRDLGTSSGAGFDDGTLGSDRAEVDPFESVDPGGRSLKVRFPAGALKTADSGVDTRIPLSRDFKDRSYTADELYVSYWIKLSDNFQLGKCGGKLPSLGGSLTGTEDGRWKGRIMWRRGGSIQFYPELPHDDDRFESDADRFWGQLVSDVDGGICEFEFSSYLTTGTWHQIQLHYKLDEGGPGGLFEGWVDGGRGYDRIDSSVFGYYRPEGGGLDELTINQLLLSAFLGGSTPEYEPSEDTFAWFDEFRVSKTKIE